MVPAASPAQVRRRAPTLGTRREGAGLGDSHGEPPRSVLRVDAEFTARWIGEGRSGYGITTEKMGDRLSGTDLVEALAWAVCFLGTVMGLLLFLAWLEQPSAERWVPSWWSRTRPADPPRVDAARVPD